MDKITDLIERMRQVPNNVACTDLCKVCDHHFGKARQEGKAIAYTRRLGMAIPA